MTTDDLLKQGIAALNEGRKTEAQKLLMQAVKQDERNEMAWLWLSGAVDTDEDRCYCLENVLAINPNNAAAQRGIETLRKRSSARVDSTQDAELLKDKLATPPVMKTEKDITQRRSAVPRTTEQLPSSEAITAPAKKKAHKRKRPINFGDIVCIVATVVGTYSALFAPWPFYTWETLFQLNLAEGVEQAGESLAFAWAYMHSFGLMYWIPVILFGFLLLLLTLVSGRLRAGVLPWLWLIEGILGSSFPFAFFLLDHIVDDGYLVKDIFLVWGLPLTFAAYASIALAAIASISQKKAQRDTQRVQCPHCAEMIMPDAKICRFCGRKQ